jgi:hypothetical protein
MEVCSLSLLGHFLTSKTVNMKAIKIVAFGMMDGRGCMDFKGLTLMWKEDGEVLIQTYSQNHIDAYVQSPSSSSWRLTGFYGNREASC